MSRSNTGSDKIGKVLLGSGWELFEPVYERIANAVAPWSVVELDLPQNQIQDLKSWCSQIPSEVLVNLETSTPSEMSIPTRAELLGCSLLIVAAETSRDTGREDALWPTVRSIFPEDSPGKKLLFTQGQPSRLLKETLEAAAQRFTFRHVLTSEFAQKYFDTIKLQYGFTLRGVRQKLHEWLIGIGQPFAVQVLLGEDPRHPELASESFQELWDVLKAYRRDRVSKATAEVVLRTSPWIRTEWVPELLCQARVKLKSRAMTLPINDAPTEGVVQGARLHWPAGTKPRFELEFNLEAFKTLVSETQSHQICAVVDGRVTGRWARQADGSWHGSNTVFCEPDTCLPEVNLRPVQLMLSTSEGDILEEIDLTTLDLHQDVLVFDGDTERLLDSEQEELRTAKSYIVVADTDLSLEGVPGVEWESVGSRKAYRLNAPWNENACLLLENLEFWRPRIQQDARQPSLRVSLTVRDREQPLLGDEVTLFAEGIPQDVESATLLLGSSKVNLEQRDGMWMTTKGVVLSPELVLGFEKRRIRLRRYTQVQTAPVKIVEPRGVAVYEPDPSSDKPGRWSQLSEAQPLNIGAGNTQIRLLGMEPKNKPVLYEGSRSLGTISQRGARLASLSLHGWGAPLVAVDKNTQRSMASAVERHGCVFYVIHELLGQRIPAAIHLRAPIERSPDHSVWLWSSGRENRTDLHCIRSEKISVENEGLVWKIGTLPDTYAIGLAFRGELLGSWWDSESLSRLLCERINVRLFALLRWFRIPVLSQTLSYNIQGAVYKAPLDFLSAWLGCQGLPEGLEAKPSDEGIKGVVRKFLWGWSERPYMVDKMLPFFGKANAASVSGVSPGMVGFAEICPPLLWAWRFKMPTHEARLLRRYLWQDHLGLEDRANQEALAWRVGAPYETLESIRASLYANDLSKMVNCSTVQKIAESVEGRAALSVLILDEIMRNRKNKKESKWDK